MANIAIVGYGNIGRGVRRALKHPQNDDMQLVSIISRDPDRVNEELKNDEDRESFVVHSAEPTEKVDVAILCGGSAKDLPHQGPFFARHANTVDSFDTHANIPEYFREMGKVASESGNVAVIATGWDPGTFSLERVLADSFIPGVRPYGFYGLGKKGGLSMGHSDAIRKVEGVADARQYTHAIPEAIKRVRSGENPVLKPGEMHWRECFVVPKEGANLREIGEKIVKMANYFKQYNTTVTFVTQEELDKDYAGMPHDGLVIASGKTGDGNSALIEYKNQWESNPEATANVLIAHARAANRLNGEGKRGAFTILDIPPAYFSPRSREKLLKDFM